MKEHYPTIYDDVKHFVKKGQFILVGGTWVEMVYSVSRHFFKLFSENSGFIPSIVVYWDFSRIS